MISSRKRGLAGLLGLVLAFAWAGAGSAALPPAGAVEASPPPGGRILGGMGPSSSGTPEGTHEAAGIKVSPEAYQRLSPEQRLLVDERMREGARHSSETRTAPGRNGPEPARKPDEMPDRAPRPQSDFLQDQQPSPAPEPLSVSEERFNARRAIGATGVLRQVGYEMFLRSPTTFALVDDAPVPPEYVIGPGDELIVSALAPQRSTDVSLIVNRDGTVLVPNLGPLPVSGMTFPLAARDIERRIKGQAGKLQVHVRMGKLRTLTVHLVGQVRFPGAHAVGGLSSVTTALMASGGPTRQGSLRRVQLRRQGKLEATLDLYDLLLKGDNSKDRRLQSGDVIFVPPVASQVALDGEFSRPGIYEVLPGTTLADVIGLAGGFAAEAYKGLVRIERIEGHEERATLNFDLLRDATSTSTAVQGGDLISVTSVPADRDSSVRLDGHVRLPGRFAYRPGLLLGEILRSADDLKPEAYMEMGLIERVMPPDQHIELIPFSLADVLAKRGEYGLALSARDRIRIYSRWDLQERPRVRIGGAVSRGGLFDLRPNMKLSELVHLAGGLRPEADRENAELTRVSVRDNRLVTERLSLSPGRIIAHEKDQDLFLERDDYFMVRAIPDYKLYRTVQLQGEVRQPGAYSIRDGEGLRSVLARAGGLTSRAYPGGALFQRESVRTLEERRIQETIRQLEGDIEGLRALPAAQDKESAASRELASKQALLESLKRVKPAGRLIVYLPQIVAEGAGQAEDLALEDGDVLNVPPLVNSVSIIGQVVNPSTVMYRPDLSLNDYLEMTGGPTDKGDRSALYVIRADGSVVTERTAMGGIWLFRRAFADRPLAPGDTIVVPDRIESQSWIGNVKDVTQVLYQIATAAAVTLGILRQ